MIFVDTGFFLALAQSKDALHERARAWAAILAEPLLVTEYVLWETVNGLSKPADRPRAHNIVSSLGSSAVYESVMATPELFDAGLQLHAQRPDKEWSLTDCISFTVMQRRNLSRSRALTPDHHFEQAGFEALLRRDPP
jgi:uncharacterized protein